MAFAIMAVAWPMGLLAAMILMLVGLAVFVAAVAVATVVVHLVVVRRWVRDGWVVGYFTRDASQLVHPDDEVWVLSEHHARRRGRGMGAWLRSVVWPHLVAESDDAGVAIRTATRVRGLADAYVREMPGLVVEGDADGCVIRMVRPPA